MTDYDATRRLEVIGEAGGLSPSRVAAAQIALDDYRDMDLVDRLALLQEKWEALTSTWEFNEFTGILAIHKLSQLPADQEVVYGAIAEPHLVKVVVGFTPEVQAAVIADEEATGA